MTYTTTYEFTAYTEQDLLSAGSGNGSDLNCGDSFTMPAGATTCITVKDDDAFLSGDSCHNENANDHWYQTATITGADGTELGNGGQIYAESYWWVYDQHGNWYVMVEVEQEGTHDDYFTFYTGHGYSVPPAGTHLTVHSACNVTSDWLDYKCLDAGIKWELDDTCTYTIEAEDLALWNFQAVHGDNASGDELIKLACNDGKASTNFGGESGTYNIKICAQDELDGDSVIKVYVNGHEVGVIVLDESQGNNGWGSNNGHFTEFSLDNIEINAGDKIELRAWQDGGEYVRIDKIAFEQVKGGDLEGRVFCDTDCDGLEVTTTTEPGCDYVIEAEHMYKWGFTTVHGDKASGGALAKLQDCYGGGDLWTHFDGKDGTYDLKIFAQDESDGQSEIFVKINGHKVAVVKLDRDTDGYGNDNGHFSEFVVPNVKINHGDQIKLWVDGNSGEFARIDRIELEGQDTIVTTPEPGKEGVLVTLTDLDGNAILDDDGNAITTLTDADGNYKFQNIDAGDYRVKFSNPDGTEFTFQNVGSDDRIDSDVDANGLSDVFTIKAGETTRDVDAGLKEAKLGSLSGKYFDDVNRDGLDNDGDNGLGGILVELLDENGNPTGRTTTTSTDAATLGDYSFDDLEAGTYGVRFIDQLTGKVLTTQNVDGDVSDDIDSDAAPVGDPTNGVSEINGIVVVGGQDTPDNDAGVITPPASISGVYFNDADRDGVNDDGLPLGGRTVTLVDTNGNPVLDIDGNPVDPVLTEADGSYTFENLAPGDYVVMFEAPQAGEEFTDPDSANGDDTNDSDVIDAANGKTATVSVAAGEDAENVDAGVREAPASISGVYFNDADRDGVNDDGLPLGGRTVTLVDTNGNPVLDIDGNPVDPVLTEADGSYTFENLAPGDYVVMFEAPQAGEEFTDPDSANGDDTNDSDVIDAANGKTATVSVAAGEDAENVDAGVREAPASISGVYFNDADRDGVNDDGLPLGGRTVTLVDTNGNPVLDIDGNPVDPVLTEADGSYTFENLAPGDYVVMFEAPQAGEEFTDPDSANGDDTNDSDVIDAANGKTATVSVAAGEDAENVDAGVREAPASISGVYFNDADRDGVNDDGLPLGGRTVTLVDTNGNPVLDIDGNPVDPVLTEADGSYTFENLAPGDYVVMFEAPQAGEEFTDPDSANGDDTNDSDVIDAANGKTATVSVAAGEDAENVDAGVREAPASISGVYFNDADRDGVNDDGLPLGGRTVTLVDTNGNPVLDIDGNPVDPVLTEADGSYTFENLAPGDYVVMFEAPQAGEEFTDPDSANGDDTNDSDVIDAANGKTATVSVVAGEDAENVDAGVREAPGSLSGRYFCDENRDGTELDDNGNPEVGVGGVLVTLLDASGNPVLDAGGNPVTTTTDSATGFYQFTGLLAGTYGVLFADAVSGKTLIAPDVNGNANDDIDSDAVSIIDPTSGLSEITGITVVAGQDTPDNDAGVENLDPTADDEVGEVCYDETVTIDLVDVNDIDPEGAALNLIAIDGIDVTGLNVGESFTLADTGVIITLGADGDIIVDGEAAVIGGQATADLLAGESAVDTFTYTLSDGTGGTGTADVTVTYKGATDTLEKIAELLPAQICFELPDIADPTDQAQLDELWTVELTTTASDSDVLGLNGLSIDEGYCVDFTEVFVLDSKVTADVTILADGFVEASQLPAAAFDHFDEINWILNNRESDLLKDFTDGEIQGAIWGFTNDTPFVFDNFGTVANAEAAQAIAEANGDGFELSFGDTVAVLLDPVENDPSGQVQPFIVGLDGLWEDCIC